MSTIVTPPATELEAQCRGTEFKYFFTLGNGWVYSMFTGGVLFTLRPFVPDDVIVDDEDAIDQATVANGDITFSTLANGTILIPAERTKLWPVRKLLWDLRGIVTTGGRVLRIDGGTIEIYGSITVTGA